MALLGMTLGLAGLAACSDRATEADLMEQGLTALYDSGKPDEAAVIFRDVLGRNPDHYGARYQLAVAFDRAGRPDAARAVWEEVLSGAESIGDQQTAATARDRLARPDPTPDDQLEIWMSVALELREREGKPEEAILLLRRILEVRPDHYGATYQMAATLDAVGRRDEAESWWARSLELAEAAGDEPTAQTARERLGRS